MIIVQVVRKVALKATNDPESYKVNEYRVNKETPWRHSLNDSSNQPF